jgi:hypothetical protein
MFKPLSKVLVVVAMLIAFVGQALAYTAMSCEMSEDSHQPHMTMDHSSPDFPEGMDHSKMKSSKSNSEDCCDVDCVCPDRVCSSVMLLISGHNNSIVLGFTEAVIIQTSEQPNSISTSLYRPPIFA